MSVLECLAAFFKRERPVSTGCHRPKNREWRIITPLKQTLRIVFPVLLATVFCTSVIFSRNFNLRFQHLGADQGLSQVSVSCIFQDSRGFMWFGTQDGLNKYDGYSFTVYRHDGEDETTLNHSNISCIAEDNLGFLWIGTSDGGLNRFDPATDRFTRITGGLAKLAGKNVNVILKDRFGYLWIGTSRGLFRFDARSGVLKTGEVQSYVNQPGNPESISGNWVTSLSEIGGNELWVGTYTGGLNKLDRQSGRFTRFVNRTGDRGSLSSNCIQCLFIDSAGRLCIGTGGGGLNILVPGSGTFTRFNHRSGDPYSLSNDNITAIREDSGGALWIGTEHGLNKLDTADGTVNRYFKHPVPALGPSENSILTLYRDRGGNLWIGTAGGLNILDSITEAFNSSEYRFHPSEYFSGKHVRAIARDRPGNIWIGTKGEGLFRFEPGTGTVARFSHHPDNSRSIADDRVWAICEDSQGELWFGTSGGLNKWDRENRGFILMENKTPGESHPAAEVLSITEDSTGNIWIGAENGLHRYDKESRSLVRYFSRTGMTSEVSEIAVRTIIEGRDGNLWVGTKKGLIKLDRKTGRFVHMVGGTGIPGSPGSDYILSLYQTSDNLLWIGTSNGLKKMNPDNKKVFRYRVKDGLPNDWIYAIAEDNDGNLWMSTNNGLTKMNRRTGTFFNYDKEDGLNNSEYNTGALFKDRDGKLYFGGINGFDWFDPGQIRKNRFIPPVVFTGFLLFNKPVPIVSPGTGSKNGQRKNFILPRHISTTEEITLKHDENIFTLEFSALNYRQPKKNRYAYKLEGFNWDWIETDYKNRRATYTNLPHGKYTFRVKASNDDGIWNEAGAVMDIVILPPPWKTWWAYALYALAALSLVSWLVAFWRQRSQVKHLREIDILNKEFTGRLEKKIEERTQELKDTQDQLIQLEKMSSLGRLVAGVSHELNNPAAFIKMNAEYFTSVWQEIIPLLDRYAREDEDFEITGLPYEEFKIEINKLLHGLTDGADRIKHIIGELKDYSRKDSPESGAHYIRQEVSIGDVLYASVTLTNSIIKKNTTCFSCQISHDLPPVFGNFQRLEQVFINLIENACLALTDNHQAIRISTRYNEAAGNITVDIADEGVGIKKKHLDRLTEPFFTTRRSNGGTGLGLSVSEGIIREHGGRLTFKSQTGKGTTVSVHLPAAGSATMTV